MVRDAQARQNVGFDLIILLDIDPKIGLNRKNPETRFELEAIDFHERVRNGYLEQARNDRSGQWIIIDGTKNANDVFLEALVAIFKLISPKVIKGRRLA